MGRVRTKTVKKSARVIVEKYYTKLTTDFPTNKQIVAEVAQIPSKSLRNKIAGFVTHLMKRIEKGPVRGISLKLQEEERERRENVVPDVSVMEEKTSHIVIDADTEAFLAEIGFDKMPGVAVAVAGDVAHHHHHHHHHHPNRGNRERRQRERGEGDIPGGKRREGRRAAAGPAPTLPAEQIVSESAAAATATQ